MSIARESKLELSIVRPSIIGPSWSFPYPGWCLDRGCPAQILSILFGSGILRTIGVHGAINVIPVDWVAAKVVDSVLCKTCVPFLFATVPTTHAWPLRQSESRCRMFEEAFNKYPESQYRRAKVYYTDGIWSKMSELLFEDSHVWLLDMCGQQKASRLVRRALKARDTVYKPYASENWDFKAQPGSIPNGPEFLDKYMDVCQDASIQTMIKHKAPTPRVGAWVDALLYTVVLASVTLITYVGVRIRNMLETGLEDYNIDYLSSSPWLSFGGMLSVRQNVLKTSSGPTFDEVVMFGLIVLITTKFVDKRFPLMVCRRECLKNLETKL